MSANFAVGAELEIYPLGQTIEPNFLSTLMIDGLRYAHLLSVALGLGIAFFADATILHRLKDPLSEATLSALHATHQFVSYALVGMWLSGLGLIYVRTGFVLSEFSPKLWAKVIVVVILTVNAMLISRFAMPRLAENVGVCPLRLPRSVTMPMALVAGVSTTSWLIALALGSSVVLKTAPLPVFAVFLPASYGLSILLSVAAVAYLRPKSSTDSKTYA